jgi:hypothetical protein
MLAPQATKVLHHLAHLTVDKQQNQYSATMNYLRIHTAITLVKTIHHVLRASWKYVPPSHHNNASKQHIEPSPEYRMLYGKAILLAIPVQ